MPRDHRLHLDNIVGAVERIHTKLDPLRVACRNLLESSDSL